MSSTCHSGPISDAPPRIPKLKYRNPINDSVITSTRSSGTPERTALSETRPATNLPLYSPPTYGFPPSPERSPNEGKSRGVLGLLSIKEPSTSAWKELADQQRKEDLMKNAGAVVALHQPTDRKMPAHVPKVNSKWDGLPIHQQRPKSPKDSWKGSFDLPPAFSRSSRKLPDESKSTISTGRSSETSLRRSNSAEIRPRLPHNTTSPKSLDATRPTISERSVSYETSEEPQKNIVRKSTSMSTLQDASTISEAAFSLDGQQRLPSEPAKSMALPLIEAELTSQPASLKTSSSSSPTKVSTPSLSIPKNSPASSPSRVVVKDSSSHANGAPKRSGHPISQAVPEPESISDSWPLPQRPFPSRSRDSPFKSDGHEVQPPPIPIKSERRTTGRGSSAPIVDGSVNDGDEPPSLSTLPVKTIHDESREYRPAPGSRIGPMSPPQSPDSSKPPKPLSGSTTSPSPPIIRTGFRPPVYLPGRTLTKDSDLATIPESDTSSILTARPISQVDVASTSCNDPDEDSIAESKASSKMSAQWFKSPRERLGLGSSIKHTAIGFSWPLPDEYDGTYTIDDDGNKIPMQASDKAMKGRASLMGIFKK